VKQARANPSMEHPHCHAAALGLDHFPFDRFAAAIGRETDLQRARRREVKVLRAVLIAKTVAGDDDRFVPVRDDAGNVPADDRLAEDGAVENVADGAVRRPPHLFQIEFLDARFVRRDRRALHRDAVLAGGVGRVNRDLIAAPVARLDAEVVVLQVDVEIRKNQRLADLLPDDARHFVAVHLDDGVFHLDLGHSSSCGSASASEDMLNDDAHGGGEVLIRNTPARSSPAWFTTSS